MEYVSNVLNDPWVNYLPKYLLTIPRRDLDTESLGKLLFYLCKANHRGDLGFNPKSASNSQWPKASQLTSLCLQFLSCKIEVVLIAKALEIIPSFLELRKKALAEAVGWNLPFDPWRYSNCGMRSQRWKMIGNGWSVTWGYTNSAGAIPEVNPEGLKLWYSFTVFNATHFTVNFFNPTIQKDTCLSLGQVRKLKQGFSQSHTAARQGGTYLLPVLCWLRQENCGIVSSRPC